MPAMKKKEKKVHHLDRERSQCIYHADLLVGEVCRNVFF